MNYEIKKQIDFLEDEIRRVKELVNKSGLDCTTSVYVIINQYRNSMKNHLQILRMNLDDE